jgi:hypothetical protein
MVQIHSLTHPPVTAVFSYVTTNESVYQIFFDPAILDMPGASSYSDFGGITLYISRLFWYCNMISIKCPKCDSKLNAKDELAGQTRKCPKCGNPIKIPAPEGQAEKPSPSETLEQSQQPQPQSQQSQSQQPQQPAQPQQPQTESKEPQQHVEEIQQGSLPSFHKPERLNRLNTYIICDRTRLVAMWQNNGKGWQLKSGQSFLSAVRNRDQLPSQGEFKLIELKVASTEKGKRLMGLDSFTLAKSWALPALAKSDDAILAKVTGHGSFSKDLKAISRMTIKEMFMHEMLEHAKDIFQFLENTDYHTHGVDVNIA